MTTNEIKTLIQNTIAGQGSQVDIGGKLAEILQAIVDAIPSSPSGETPRPIVLTEVPEDGDTVETLAEKGLTVDEIIAASRGERTCVVISPLGSLFDIFTAYGGDDRGSIVFGAPIFDTGGALSSLMQFSIDITGNSVTVNFVEL